MDLDKLVDNDKTLEEKGKEEIKTNKKYYKVQNV